MNGLEIFGMGFIFGLGTFLVGLLAWRKYKAKIASEVDKALAQAQKTVDTVAK